MKFVKSNITSFSATQRPSIASVDLAANLGNILAPSMPDFGYEDVLNFDEEKEQKKPKGWGRFLDLINR